MVNAAAYKYDITPHQALYIGGQGLMTLVTLQSNGPGQQQQSAQQFSTGKWTAVPLLYVLSDRIVVVISTLNETYTLQVQGSQTQMSTGAPSGALEALISQTHPSPLQRVDDMPSSAMPSMQPMKPMQPMTPMSMTMTPMSMNMGNMSMTMDSTAASTSTSQSNTSRHATAPDTADNGTTDNGTAQPKTTQPKTAQPKTAQPKTTAQDTTAQDTTVKNATDSQQKVKRFCSQCGEGVQPGDRFCAYCGNAL